MSNRPLINGSSRLARVVNVALTVVVVMVVTAGPSHAIDVSPQAPPGTEDVQTVLNWIGWGASIAGVIGMIAVGILMALAHRRGEGGEHMGKLGLVLGGVLVATAAGPVVSLLAG